MIHHLEALKHKAADADAHEDQAPLAATPAHIMRVDREHGRHDRCQGQGEARHLQAQRGCVRRVKDWAG